MSTLTVTNIKKTGETASRDVSGVAAAWINFNGTGTIAIRNSINVSSITDIGTGYYRENFSSAFSAADYAVGSFAGGSANVRDVIGTATAFSVGNCEMVITNSAEAAVDAELVTTSTHGDLA